MKCGRNARETAIYLGVSERQVFRLVENGFLTSYRVGSRVVFYEEDIEKYLERCRQPAQEEQVTAPVTAPERRRKRG